MKLSLSKKKLKALSQQMQLNNNVTPHVAGGGNSVEWCRSQRSVCIVTRNFC
ncbi:hypothetical protein ACSLBF_20835 (plasmid) [Pseudoalteromonas sp. T1lg65]|uniref:hypothetical protein n=1 Tax=Pseudoalteromonas sp. T1lg65 TaxID=2077101 RepID=UPI003F7A6EE9